MIITKTQHNGSLTIALDGRMDITTAPDLEREIKNLDGGVTELIMDFEKLIYISSAGLRVLLLAHKKMLKQGGTMKVIHVGEAVMEVFDITGFSNIIKII